MNHIEADKYNFNGKTMYWNGQINRHMLKYAHEDCHNKFKSCLQKGILKVIFIVGPPGSGKSTLAKELNDGNQIIISNTMSSLKYFIPYLKIIENHEVVNNVKIEITIIYPNYGLFHGERTDVSIDDINKQKTLLKYKRSKIAYDKKENDKIIPDNVMENLIDRYIKNIQILEKIKKFSNYKEILNALQL